MNLAVTILVDGITYASWLFIVALGLTLVFGVLKILNIAHGSFYAVGAYMAATFVTWFANWQLPPWMSIFALLLAPLAVLRCWRRWSSVDCCAFFTGVTRCCWCW